MHARGQSGFTLIEVLIAATVLFVVIAAATEAYRGALASSRRAEETVRLLAPLPLITAAVRESIRARPEPRLDGGGELLGVRYSFEARTAAYGAPPRRFDPDTSGFREYPPRFRLYDVVLTLGAGERRREFRYREVAWEPAAT